MNVSLHKDARTKLKEGVDILANAVKATLGPKGRNVVIQRPYKNIHITKDGVTVADSIYLEDPIQNLGAQILKQAAAKTGKIAGDGTTTSTVLAQAMLHEGLKLVEAGSNPIDLTRGMKTALDVATAAIKEVSQPVKDDWDMIENVAAISANNDPNIGRIIRESFEKVGTEGVISVAESKTSDTYIEETKGMQLSRGYVSPYFSTDTQRRTVEFENPLIFIYDRSIRTSDEVLPIVQMAAERKRPLLIVADDIEGPALQVLLINRIQAGLPIAAMKAPAFGDRRKQILQDMATLTGATLISETFGYTIQDTSIQHLGSADSVTMNRTSTTIVGGHYDEEEFQERLDSIREEISTAPTDYQLEKAKERLAKLQGGVAVIHVGGHTELEVKEKKDRIDDALHATRAALKEGIVPGGGSLFMRISKLMHTGTSNNMNEDSRHGFKIVKNALQSITRTIVENSGKNFGEVKHLFEVDITVSDVYNQDNWDSSILKELSKRTGYNAHSEKYEDLFEAGVIDPAMVLRTALENATSVASLILMTEATVSPLDIEMNTNKPPMAQQ